MNMYNVLECDNPKLITEEIISDNLERLKKSHLLVLCGSELFFQNEDGSSIDSMYPVSDSAAIFIAYLVGKPIMLG